MNTYTEVELKRLKNIKSIKTVKLSFEFSNVWLVQCGSRESITQFDSGGGGGRGGMFPYSSWYCRRYFFGW